MNDKQKARVAHATGLLQAMLTCPKTSSGILMPTAGTVNMFGKPTSQTPASTDLTFAFLKATTKPTGPATATTKKRT